MNYDEAIEYIETVSCSGIMPGLVRIQALLEKTEHPEKKCNVIHVAGTNGKGSVCSYVSSILMKAGYRVGRYVSPTLFDYRERIQINDSWISKADTAYWMSRVREANERMQAEGMEGASAFELETVMAFLYFKSSRCDFVVLETAMGGRLDATNVVAHPLVPPKREESSKTNVRRLLGPGAGRLSIHWLKFVIRNTAGIGLLTETQQLFILRIFMRDRYLIMRTAVMSEPLWQDAVSPGMHPLPWLRWNCSANFRQVIFLRAFQSCRGNG